MGAFARAPHPEFDQALVQGHSGCEVALHRTERSVSVEKRATDPAYSNRLERQIAKQKQWADELPLTFVRVPRVLEEGARAGCYFARMEYVYFLDSVRFFETASRSTIDQVARMIFETVDYEVSRSPLCAVPASVFLRKLDDVAEALRRQQAFEHHASAVAALRQWFDSRAGLELPLGLCHGDLTFSNLMLSSDAQSLALIDFLDSFLESPIVDLAKLQQDTRFCWTLFVSQPQADRTRFRQVMAYIDALLCRRYGGQAWYARNIDALQCLNLLRIAPYAKDMRTHRFLQQCLQSLKLQP